jgi:hypothetical protein
MPERIVPVDVALPQYGVSALVGGRA